MNPQQPLNPNQPNPQTQQSPGQSPQVFGPAGLPNAGTTPANQPPKPANGAINDPDVPKSKKGLIIAAIAGGAIIIILIIVVLVANGGNKSAKQTSKKTAAPTTTQVQAIQPAQGVEVEQINNSLSQDLSRLDDEKDLPNDSLTDATLGL